MRALRLLVIVLGVLLVGGTLDLGVAIIVRSPRPSESRPPDSAKLPYDTVLDLPAGAVLESTETRRAPVHAQPDLPSGKGQVAVSDGGSLVRPRTIKLRPRHR